MAFWCGPGRPQACHLMSARMPTHTLVHKSAGTPIHRSMHISTRIFIQMPVRMFMHMPPYMSACMPVHMSMTWHAQGNDAAYRRTRACLAGVQAWTWGLAAVFSRIVGCLLHWGGTAPTAPGKPGKAPMSVLVHRSPAIARAVCAPKKNGSPGAMCTQLRTCGHSRLPPLLA